MQRNKSSKKEQNENQNDPDISSSLNGEGKSNAKVQNDFNSPFDSIKSTPRDNPLNDMKKIDLTLGSAIKPSDIKEALIHFFTDFVQTSNNTI